MSNDVQISKIKVTENHRVNVDQTNIPELMQSIKQHGLKQPIGLAKGKNGNFDLIFGNRRLIACEKLGWKRIPAIVETDVSKEKMLILNLTENMQREDPTLVEFGRIIQQLEDNGLSLEEIAVRIGMNAFKIKGIAKLYKLLPEKLRKRVVFVNKRKRPDGAKGVPASVAHKLITIKKTHGLTDKTMEKMFDHVEKTGASSKDIDSLASVVNRGVDVDEAINILNCYENVAIHVLVDNKDMNRRMLDSPGLTRGLLIRRVLYGEAPALKKPDIVETGIRDTKKRKSVIEKQNEENHRLDTIRGYLGAQDRLGKLTANQSAAFKLIRKVATKKLSEGQIEQLKDIYQIVQEDSK